MRLAVVQASAIEYSDKRRAGDLWLAGQQSVKENMAKEPRRREVLMADARQGLVGLA